MLTFARRNRFGQAVGKPQSYVKLVPWHRFKGGRRIPALSCCDRREADLVGVDGPMRAHLERHRTDRVGWLRAAVLGANDGIVSTASLIIGVAAAQVSRGEILVAGVAGMAAGAMSMAAGEYVSVSSQADTEQADLARERAELETDVVLERDELAGI